MATESFEIESTMDAGAAFAQLIDLSRVSEWDRGITDPHLVDGEQGAVGARYGLTVTGFDGAPTTAFYELTAVDAPASFTMVGLHETFRADDTVTVRPTPNGCRVTYDAGLVLLGDHPPLDEEQLTRQFAKIVAVPKAGLTRFLNP